MAKTKACPLTSGGSRNLSGLSDVISMRIRFLCLCLLLMQNPVYSYRRSHGLRRWSQRQSTFLIKSSSIVIVCVLYFCSQNISVSCFKPLCPKVWVLYFTLSSCSWSVFIALQVMYCRIENITIIVPIVVSSMKLSTDLLRAGVLDFLMRLFYSGCALMQVRSEVRKFVFCLTDIVILTVWGPTIPNSLNDKRRYVVLCLFRYYPGLYFPGDRPSKFVVRHDSSCGGQREP